LTTLLAVTHFLQCTRTSNAINNEYFQLQGIKADKCCNYNFILSY